jgi:hypothetical protein
LLPRLKSLQRGSTGFMKSNTMDYRCQVLLQQGQGRVFTRNGHDWTDRFPSIVRAAANLRCQVQNGNGASDFEALSSALRRQPHSIILYGRLIILYGRLICSISMRNTSKLRGSHSEDWAGPPLWGRACLSSPALISARCRNRSAYTRSTCGLTAKAVWHVVIQPRNTTLHI